MQRPEVLAGGGRLPDPAQRPEVPRRLRHVRAPTGLSGGRGAERVPAAGGLSRPRRGLPRHRRCCGPPSRTTVPCNNDLLAANFIDDGRRVWLIDYEYPATTTPASNSGNIWAECGLSTGATRRPGHCTTAARNVTKPHVRTCRESPGSTAGHYRGCIQSATSPIDFDFWGWAMERYDSAVAEFRAPRFRRLLDDAQASD